MLGKLLKYDFRHLFRLFLPFSLAATLAAVGGGALFRVLPLFKKAPVAEIACYLGIFACGLILVVFPVAITLACVFRYYRNFFTDEGYLTFTLPVTRTMNLVSKVLASFITILCGYAVWIVEAALVVFVAKGTAPFEELFEFVASALKMLAALGELPLWITMAVMGLLAALLSMLMNINVGFFSVTLGALAAKKHRLLLAFAIYYGISTLFGGVFEVGTLTYVFYFPEAQALLETPLVVLGIVSIISLLASVGFFLWNRFLIQKHLNLA